MSPAPAAIGGEWDAAVTAFAEHLATSPRPDGKGVLSLATRSDHLVHLRRLARSLEVGPWDLDVDELEAYISAQSWGPHTAQKARLVLRRFYSWATAEGLVERPPVDLGPSGLPEPWQSALSGFLAHLHEVGRTPATAECYVQHVRWLATSLPVGPWEIEPRQLGDWLNQQAWSETTRRRVLTSLRTFYAWAVAERLIEWSPVAGLPAPEHRRRGPAPKRLAKAWEQPVWDFSAWLRGSKRQEATVAQRCLHLRWLSEVAADPWSVSTGQLQLWLSNPDWSPGTARSARSSIRVFYRWALLAGHIEVSPADRLESIRVPRSLPRPTPDGALRQALAGADDRTRLMICLGALGGLRRAEIARLHTRQISPTEMHIIGKGGHHRIVPMHPLLWQELNAEFARRRQGRHGTGWNGRFVKYPGYLFPSDLSPEPLTPRWVGRLVSLALPDTWTTHSLRHRFATMSYAEQRDLLAVQQLLGHSKPETTAVYARVPDGALRTAVLGVTL